MSFFVHRSRLPARGPAHSPRRGLLLITGAAFLWGTTGVVLQYIRLDSGIGTLAAAFYRLAISAAVLLLVTGRSLVRGRAALSGRTWSLVAAGIGLAAYQALYFLGVAWAGVSIATVVSLGVAPVVTLLWESAAARRLPRPNQLMTVVLAIAGLALLSFGHSASTAAPHPVAGLLASVGSGVTYGLTTIASRHVAQTVPSSMATAVNACVGALFLLPIALLADGLGFRPTFGTIGGLAFIGVFTTAIAYLMFNSGLRHTPTSVASVLTLVEPLAAAVLAVSLLHETLTGTMIAGGALLLAAVLLLYWKPAGAPTADGGPAAGHSPVTDQ